MSCRDLVCINISNGKLSQRFGDHVNNDRFDREIQAKTNSGLLTYLIIVAENITLPKILLLNYFKLNQKKTT